MLSSRPAPVYRDQCEAAPGWVYSWLVVLFQAQRWRLLLLFLASGAGLLSAGAPRSQDLSRALSSPTVSGWALADFNGDDSFDLATANSARHDARGYAQEVQVGFGSYQRSSFKFRSRSATVDLSTPDVDGDQDRDLVVREPLSMTPIGVWINDGKGSFHEGNLADFPGLDRPKASTAWRVQRQHILLLAVFDERPPLVTETSSIHLRFARERLARPTDPSRQDPHSSRFRNRGPPLNP